MKTGPSINRNWVETNLRQYIVSQRIIIQNLTDTIHGLVNDVEDLKDYIKVLEDTADKRKASLLFPLPPPA